VLHLLIDTSTWLDIAKRRDGQRWVVPLRVLMFQRKLEILVPSVIIDEFDRNRPRVEDTVAREVIERFRTLRADIREYGGADRQEWLDELSHQIPMISSATIQNFSEISELLRTAQLLVPSPVEVDRVVRRGISNRAPFRPNKNSTADAMIIELYASVLPKTPQPEHRYCFVTSNYLDFSVPNGDRREPHPDIADLFADPCSTYLYGEDGLAAALALHLGDDFLQEVEEVEAVREEPRTFAEILEAEREFFDKVWYVRKLIMFEKIEDGEEEPLTDEMHEHVRSAMRAIEEHYGAENVGPWDDWEWGFVHGKLSALRWVLGSEWDFLDT